MRATPGTNKRGSVIYLFKLILYQLLTSSHQLFTESHRLFTESRQLFTFWEQKAASIKLPLQIKVVSSENPCEKGEGGGATRASKNGNNGCKQWRQTMSASNGGSDGSNYGDPETAEYSSRAEVVAEQQPFPNKQLIPSPSGSRFQTTADSIGRMLSRNMSKATGIGGGEGSMDGGLVPTAGGTEPKIPHKQDFGWGLVRQQALHLQVRQKSGCSLASEVTSPKQPSTPTGRPSWESSPRKAGSGPDNVRHDCVTLWVTLGCLL